MRVGVLAIQGAFIEHERALERIGIEPVEVRRPDHMDGLDGLIIPGGESTTIGKVAQEWKLLEPIRTFANSGRPLWGTCAGMILMAREIIDGRPGQPSLAVMDIAVRRNAFGRQTDSFVTELEVPVLGEPAFPAIFIRAPLVERSGRGIEILARLEDGTTVAVRQGNLLATAFHPELSGDDRLHQYFVQHLEAGSKR